MKIIRFAIIGLLIGLSSSYTIVTFNLLADSNAPITGKELFEQVIIAAILGIVIGLISLIFKTERFSFTLQLFIHFIVVTICVFAAGNIGEWYDVTSIATIISLLISIVVIYIISWGIALLLQKRDIEEMNLFIQKRRENL
ncbi:DUF3021 domain-containing protein [Lysinibacillus telephonicus]|uniref:DUF3021 domain-containing protein n=1 Tax=Lysinibacillus telephonicus TaxID=1714840 RepID=A0A3S0JRJ9_9BACI|nr:DUF3021 domain-containing protein [Lysinibacillus telephonicus]